jgi:hypothetical protein
MSRFHDVSSALDKGELLKQEQACKLVHKLHRQKTRVLKVSFGMIQMFKQCSNKIFTVLK